MTTYIKNKKAGLKYEILDKYEAGIKLLGLETKSIKNNKGSLEGSHITVRGGEVILLNANIPPYQANNTPENYNPLRNRTLLLNKKEIKVLAQKEDQKGLTIIPISVYNNKGKIKVEIAIVRGKKKYDHRETIKKKDMKRDSERELKEKMSY